MPVILSILTFALVIAALVDIIVRDDTQVRHLPKFAWILLVIVVPAIGSIVWFAVGHDWSATVQRTTPAPRLHPAPPPVHDELSTERQLAELEREIEQYEQIRELEAKLEERRRKRAQ